MIVPVCDKITLKKNKQIIKFINEINDEIIIFFNDNKVLAYSSFCPHFGGPIKKEGKNLRCTWHDYKFCPTTGNISNKKCSLKLNEYKVIEKDDFYGVDVESC